MPLSVTPVGAGDDGALPPDGGTPFAAYAARIAAIQAADWSARKQVTAPEEITAEIAEAGSERAAAAECGIPADRVGGVGRPYTADVRNTGKNASGA